MNLTGLSTPLLEVLEYTWPAATRLETNGWIIRDGRGGGKRVSSALWMGTGQPDISFAENQMYRLNQTPIFQMMNGEDALFRELGNRNYKIVDHTDLLIAPIENLLPSGPMPSAQTYAVWPPLFTMQEIWTAGGIGPSRLQVMNRVTGPKTAVLARNQDSVAGTAFVGIHKEVAMIHAVEVAQNHRRVGVARKIMEFAAVWAHRNGAKFMSLAVTEKNSAAQALYRGLGMDRIGHYCYRIKEDAE